MDNNDKFIKNDELKESELKEVVGGMDFSDPRGVLCPVCQKARVKMTLGDYLYGDGFTCPCCKTKFSINNPETNALLQELFSQQKSNDRES